MSEKNLLTFTFIGVLLLIVADIYAYQKASQVSTEAGNVASSVSSAVSAFEAII